MNDSLYIFAKYLVATSFSLRLKNKFSTILKHHFNHLFIIWFLLIDFLEIFILETKINKLLQMNIDLQKGIEFELLILYL